MNRELYNAGAEHALRSLRLEKIAFIGLARTAIPAIGRGLASAGRAIGSGYGKVVNPAVQAAQRLETAAPAAMGSKFGPTAERVTRSAIEGVPTEMVRQTAIGGVLGAGLGGAAGAVTAEPGSRMSGALRGAASGAGQGALFGGVAGLGGKAVTNLTREGLGQVARSRGAGTMSDAVARAQQAQGLTSNLKQVFTGKGPMGRAGAGLAAAGSIGGVVGGEMVLPNELQKRMNTPPEMQRVASAHSDDAYTPPPLPVANLLSTAGGVTAGLGTGLLFNYLQHKKLAPEGGMGLARQIASPLASTAAGLTAYRLGQKHFPSPQDTDQEKLKQLDIDKLLRHYKRTDKPS
jgi:hypothetical protein